MLKRDGGKQLKMTFLTLEELMPEKHFLRDLERCVDFSFIYDIVEPLYAKVGRPSIDPVLLVKMLLLGYLYGIPSERKLEQEVRVNIAFRWFLGIDFDEPVPDHSTISQLRRRKFGGTTLFQDIFDEVIRKCMAAGLVSGKLLLTDSTHILANATKEKIKEENTLLQKNSPRFFTGTIQYCLLFQTETIICSSNILQQLRKPAKI